MKKRRPSLKDIAKKLDVSITTVSFVINGKGKEMKISDDVINKVTKYIAEINYRPNKIAQSLRTGESKIIVFMVEDISNPFFAKIARIIEDIAYEQDYKILFCSNENNDARSRELIALFNERRVDGFIIIPSSGIQDDIANLMNSNVPVVLCDRYFKGLDTPYVIINNEEASYHATRHLLDNGFKKIALITTDVQQTQMLGRLDGYNRALKEANLEGNILKIPFHILKSVGTKELIGEFMSENSDLDSVFFTTNYLTQNGLEIIKETNKELLNTLGIITFDDNDFFNIYTPTISAIAQPMRQIGEELMNIMLKLLKNGTEQPNETKVLSAELIGRESSTKRDILSIN